MDPDARLFALDPRAERTPYFETPREDEDDVVSSESPFFFLVGESTVVLGKGGGTKSSAGASNPFLVVGVLLCLLPGTLNKFFAFGAEATRRINRLAALGRFMLSAFMGFCWERIEVRPPRFDESAVTGGLVDLGLSDVG